MGSNAAASTANIIRPEIRVDCRDRGSRARGAFPTQYSSRMETVREKQEEEADTRTIVKE